MVFQTCTLINKLKPIKFNNYYELNIPLYGKSEEKVKELETFLTALNNKIIEDTKKYKEKWFDKDIESIQFRNLINTNDSIENEWTNGSISFKIS